MALKSAFAKASPGRVVVKSAPKMGTSQLIGKKPSVPGGLMPAVAAPTSQPTAGMPIDPQFGADENAAQLNLSTTLQQNAAARAQLGSTYGFGVDAAGNAIDDHTNPFSRAAAVQTAYDNSKRGTQNSYAARGQLYSGAILNAQNWNTQQNLRGRDTLIREYMANRQTLANSDTSAQNAYQSAHTAAESERAQRALEEARQADYLAAWAQMAQQHAAAQQAAQAQQARAAATRKPAGGGMSTKKLVGRR